MPTYHIEDSYNSRFFDDTEAVISGVGEGGSITDHDGSDLVLVIQYGRYAAGACNKTTNAEEIVLQVDKDGGGYVTVQSGSGDVRITTATSLVDGAGTPDRITAGTMTDGSGGSCGNGWETGEEDENNTITKAVSANYLTDGAFGLNFSNAAASSVYSFQLYNIDTATALTKVGTIGTVTMAAVAATQLVHTDGGEDYCLVSDNDGSAITITESVIHHLVHTDAGEDYLLLDDNDGNALDLAQHFLTTAGCYHLHYADAVPFPVLLANLDSYHVLADDGPIPLPGAPTVISTDFSEYTTSQQPSDWTERWNTGNCSAIVEADASFIGGKKLTLASTSDEEQLLTWDAIDGVNHNQQILIRFKYTSTDEQCIRLVCRASGSAGSETGLVAEIKDDQLNLLEYDNGTPTTITGGKWCELSALVVGRWYFFRMTCWDHPTNPELLAGECTATIWDGEGVPLNQPSNVYPESYYYSISTNTDLTVTNNVGGWMGVGGYGQDCEIDYVSMSQGHELANSEKHNPIFAAAEPTEDQLNYTIWGGYPIAAADYNEAGLNGVRAQLGEISHLTRAFEVVGARIWCGATHSSQLRIGVYQRTDDDEYDTQSANYVPTASELMVDMGLTAGTATDQYIEVSCTPTRLRNFRSTIVVWKGNDSGFFVRYKNAINTPAGDGNFEHGRFDPAGFSSDESVAFPSTWPAGGWSTSGYEHDVALILNEINVQLYDLDSYHLLDDNGGSPLTLGFSTSLSNLDSYHVLEADPFYFILPLDVDTESYHLHDAEEITELSVTAWSGGDPSSEGTSAVAKNYRMIVLSTDFSYGESDGYVRAKLVGAPTESVTINGASIGQRKAAADAFDYDTSSVLHTRFTFNGGDPSVTIPAGSTVWSDWVPFAIDDTKDHLLHIFVSAAHKYSYRVTSDSYNTTAGNDQTMMADVSGYSLVSEFLFFAQLEVRPRTAMTGFADTYHLHDGDNVDPLGIILSTTEEAYHEHYVDGIPLAVPLYHTDAGEDYLLHIVDQLNINPTLADLNSYNLHDGDNVDLTVTLATLEECYHLLDDNDGNPILVSETGITTLQNLDSYNLHYGDNVDTFDFTLVTLEECYHLLDDNDGNPLDLSGIATLANLDCYHIHDAQNIDEDMWNQHFLITAGCYHLHDLDPSDLANITLSTTEECYHILEVDPIDLTQLHILDVDESYHILTNDPVTLSGAGYLGVMESYHLLDDNDGSAIALSQLHDLVVEESGHDIVSDQLNLSGVANLANLDSYHLLTSDEPSSFEITIAFAETYHLLDDNSGSPLTITEVPYYFLIIPDAYHLVVSDEPLPTMKYLRIEGDFLAHEVDSITITTPSLLLGIYKTRLVDLGVHRSLVEITENRTLVRLSA